MNSVAETNVIQVKDREHFHNLRSKGIGASDIASVIGVSPWKTPLQLWQEKTGKISAEFSNEYTEAGNKIEPVVAEYFEDRSGHRVIKKTADDYLVIHPVHDYIRVHPDREYFTKDKTGRGILECKTKYFGKPERGNIPEEWFCQNQYQLGTAEKEHGSIAWISFSFGVQFDYEEFAFNREFYDYLVNEAGDFWHNHVIKDIPPDPINAEDVTRAFPEHLKGKAIEASEELHQAYQKLYEVRSKIMMLDADKKHYEEIIKMAMQDAERVTYAGKDLITWRKAKDSVVVDTAKLKADEEVFSKYSKVRPGARKFLVKS